jgi:hypothetical protein
MTTWYLSGPMTGIDDLNFPAFAHAAATLREAGYTVRSPHESPVQERDATWADFIRTDLVTLAGCTGIVLLRGWSKSQGAQLELGLALRLGFEVRRFNETTGSLDEIG